MIELRDVTKTYVRGGARALDGLSLTVQRGELFGFLGPNGAGKTTTIKTLIGLLKPDSGSVRVEDIDVLKNPIEVKRRIGYVPDEPALYENMSGLRFLSFIADVYGVGNAERVIIEKLAEEFELKDALPDRIASYSHGMKQKVSIIAALLHDPDVFILDEPIVGLDPRSAFLLKEKMRSLCKRGKTVFFSTHVLDVAERLCDQVGIIHRGGMIAVGQLEELRSSAGEENATLERLFLELTDGKFDQHTVTSEG